MGLLPVLTESNWEIRSSEALIQMNEPSMSFKSLLAASPWRVVTFLGGACQVKLDLDFCGKSTSKVTLWVETPFILTPQLSTPIKSLQAASIRRVVAGCVRQVTGKGTYRVKRSLSYDDFPQKAESRFALCSKSSEPTTSNPPGQKYFSWSFTCTLSIALHRTVFRLLRASI